MTHRQSNNVLPDLRKYLVDYLGQNYALDGCMAFLMERLGEDPTVFDYWFFSGLTGDNLTQLFSLDYTVNCFCLSAVGDKDYVTGLFDACGYDCTYVPASELRSNREMYINTLIEYIDKGIPIIARSGSQYSPGSMTYYALICGYEDYGKKLLYLFDNCTETETLDIEACVAHDWIFADAKKEPVDIPALYRKIVIDIPKLIAKPKTYNCSFGAQAFRDWADHIEGGRFDNVSADQFNQWSDHATYVCMLATNASCRTFLERALNLHPDMTFISDVISQFKMMADKGGLWSQLEAIEGGFNVKLGGLKDKQSRKAIADKIREFAACYDKILAICDKI